MLPVPEEGNDVAALNTTRQEQRPAGAPEEHGVSASAYWCAASHTLDVPSAEGVGLEVGQRSFSGDTNLERHCRGTRARREGTWNDLRVIFRYFGGFRQAA